MKDFVFEPRDLMMLYGSLYFQLAFPELRKEKMTDLEMTKLCAEAMGFEPELRGSDVLISYGATTVTTVRYHPLDNDAQMAALVKKFWLRIEPPFGSKPWLAARGPSGPFIWDADLNRAVVECVAQMQTAKVTP